MLKSHLHKFAIIPVKLANIHFKDRRTSKLTSQNLDKIHTKKITRRKDKTNRFKFVETVGTGYLKKLLESLSWVASTKQCKLYHTWKVNNRGEIRKVPKKHRRNLYGF